MIKIKLGKKQVHQRGYGRGILNLIVYKIDNLYFVKNAWMYKGAYHPLSDELKGFVEVKPLYTKVDIKNKWQADVFVEI